VSKDPLTYDPIIDALLKEKIHINILSWDKSKSVIDNIHQVFKEVFQIIKEYTY
jgi:hypothetical protein